MLCDNHIEEYNEDMLDCIYCKQKNRQGSEDLCQLVEHVAHLFRLLPRSVQHAEVNLDRHLIACGDVGVALVIAVAVVVLALVIACLRVVPAVALEVTQKCISTGYGYGCLHYLPCLAHATAGVGRRRNGRRSGTGRSGSVDQKCHKRQHVRF